MILICNAFNALAMGCFRGHPFLSSLHVEIHVMVKKLPHLQDEISAGRKKLLMEGSILWKTQLKKLGYKLRVHLNTGEGKHWVIMGF